MTGRDFLVLAHSLANQSTEAAWRSAVSRAYYATFHVARQLLTDLNFRVPFADRAHGFLWLRLQNCGEAPIQTAGVNLKELRKYRNDADYDFSYNISQAFARSKLIQAESIILALEAAALEPVRSQITTAMKNYEVVIGNVTWHP